MKPPVIEQVVDPRVNPGGQTYVWGANLRDSYVLELVDARGSIYRTALGHCDGAYVDIPPDAAEGGATLRLRVREHEPGEELDDEAGAEASAKAAPISSPELPIEITSAPLPPHLYPDEITPVAAGQWTDLVHSFSGVLERSERTELQFTQGEITAVIRTTRPTGTRFQVPSSLHPGPVALRARTWRKGIASDWSEPVPYQVADRPVAAHVQWISVGPVRQSVAVGSKTPPSQFHVTAGDELELDGVYPVHHPDHLTIRLDGLGRTRRLRATARSDKSLRITLPPELEPGAWRLSIESQSGTPGSTVSSEMMVHPLQAVP